LFENSYVRFSLKGITLTAIFLAGSGVVTRRPLILQLVHTPSKNKTTTSKISAKEKKPKGLEDDEDGEACECKATELSKKSQPSASFNRAYLLIFN